MGEGSCSSKPEDPIVRSERHFHCAPFHHTSTSITGPLQQQQCLTPLATMSTSEGIPLVKPNPHDERNVAKLTRYQSWVYFTTFLAYANSHFSRKCYTNVKKQLHVQAGMSTALLSRLDTAFMFTYAIGNVLSGNLGDRFRPTIIVGTGLLGSAICVMLLAEGVWLDLVHKSIVWGNVYFLVNWLAHGFFQSTGGPVNTAIMGNWFGKKNRGLIFGTWTSHQYVGNIIAALVATSILDSDLPYMWAVVIPAISNAVWAFVMYFLVPVRPAEKGIVTEENASKAHTEDDADLPPPITYGEALKIPSVVQYALAFGFFKLVNYVLFFWLPFFLTLHYTPAQSNLISTLYDVGMMPGGIIVGFVSDIFGGRRATVIAVFLSLLCILLWVFAEYSDTMDPLALLVMLGCMGVLVGGPNNIITSAVAADLASHPTIQGNNRALGTVTGIINGSGSVVAAIGLLAVGPLSTWGGWPAVWYFLIGCTLVGMLLLGRKIRQELASDYQQI